MLSTVSLTTRLDQILQGWGDRLNPMVVREVRQSLKNKIFLLVFFLLLLGSWSASTLGMLSYSSSINYLELGPIFFRRYLIGLIACLLVAIPANAFFSMAQEFREKSFEVLAVTTLTPRKIVFGKLQGALVMVLIYSSAVVPFLCLSYLLGGVGLISVFFSLVFLGTVSLTLSLFAVMMGSLSQKPWMEILNLIILLIAAMITCGISYAIMEEFVIQQNVNLSGQLMGFACFGVFLGFMGLMSLGVAQAQLTTTYLPMNYRRNPIAPKRILPLSSTDTGPVLPTQTRLIDP